MARRNVLARGGDEVDVEHPRAIQQQAAEGRVILGARYEHVQDARFEVEPKGLSVRAGADGDTAPDADLLVAVQAYYAPSLGFGRSGRLFQIPLVQFRALYKLKA